MIKAVETEFGFRIFLRGRGGVTLTEEGARVLPYLREIVKWNERLTQTVGSLNGLIAGTLRIGSFSSIAAHWLPQIIKRFQSDYPNIKIEITEGGTDALEAALEEGAADLALMTCQPGRRGRHRRARSGARGGRGGPRAHDLPARARLRALRALLRPVPRDTAAGAPARHARRIPARSLQRRGLRHRHAQLRLRDEPHTRRTFADAEHKIHLARREDDFLDGRKRPRRQHTARARHARSASAYCPSSSCAAGPAAPSRSR